MRADPPPPAAAIPRTGEVLLEREQDLEEIARFVDGAGPPVLLIEGPAGIGKTSLLARVRGRAENRAVRVLTARAGELEQGFAFGVVRQLFEAHLARLDSDGHATAFSGAAAPSAGVFDVAGHEGAAAPDPSFAILHGLYWLTLNLSDGGVLLAVDDLHWADAPSLRFLSYLSRRVDDAGILVAATARTSPARAEPAALDELASAPGTRVLRPGPLGPDATAALIADRLGEAPDEPFAAECHRVTGGNPLLLGELLGALARTGVLPRGEAVPRIATLGGGAINRLVGRRLAGVPHGGPALARAVAVLGDGADLRTASQLAGMDEATAAHATGHLTEAEILLPGLPLQFVHPLVREAVYAQIAPGERERAHTAAAGILRGAGAPDERVAAHAAWIPPGSAGWIAGVLHAAGRDALAKGAPDVAADYLRRALAEPAASGRDARLLVRDLGLAEALTSGPAAAGHLRTAHEQTTDFAERAFIAVVASRVLVFTGATAEAAELLRLDLAAAPPGPSEERDLLEAALAEIAFFDGRAVALDGPEVARAVDPSRRTAPASAAGMGARQLAGVAAYQAAMRCRPSGEAVELALEAVSDGLLVATDDASPAFVGALIALVLADRSEALDVLDALREQAHRSGSLFGAAASAIFRGFALQRRGDLDEAERMLRAATADVSAWGFTSAALYPAAFLADVLVARGDPAGARSALDAVPVDLRRSWDAQIGWWQAAQLRVLLAEQRFEEAVRAADDCGNGGLGEVVTNPAWIPWQSLRAEGLLGLGRTQEAALGADAEVEQARRWGAPGALGRALRIAGLARRTAGLPLLEEAVAVTADSIAMLEHAHALLALGTMTRLDRRPADAREPLRRAVEIALRCGASGLAEQARNELRAAGARPRTDAVAGVRALTPSERRVVDLAAAGRTNREIAQALYVTPKTVEVHLSSAYRKLGVAARSDLHRVLAG